MTRTTWVAVFLLGGSNLAWFLASQEQRTTGATDTAEVLQYEETIAELQEEVAQLRLKEPSLMGAMDADAPRPSPPTAGSDAPPTGKQSLVAEDAAAKRAVAAKAKGAKDQATAAAMERAREMLRKVMQVEDAGLRREGLREIADALESKDEALVEYTLSVLHSLRETEFDRGVFMGAVRGHLESENGGIRRSALYALHAVDPEGADVRVVLESATDPSPTVRGHTARLLRLYGTGEIRGEAADAVVALLADEHSNVRRGTLRGISGAEVVPEVERKLIEMAQQSSDRHEAVYFGLSQIKNKSRAVVDALFRHLEDPNRGTRKRAHWGLQRGVAKEHQFYVAQRYADGMGKFLSKQTHREALKLIARYGDGRLVPQLERFAENELVDAEVRASARKVASYLATRR